MRRILIHSGVKGMKWRNHKLQQVTADQRILDKTAKVDKWYNRQLLKLQHLGKGEDSRILDMLNAEYNLKMAETPEEKKAAKKAYAKTLADKNKPPIKAASVPINKWAKTPQTTQAVSKGKTFVGTLLNNKQNQAANSQ